LDEISFTSQGCKKVQQWSDGTAFQCPPGVASILIQSGQAREDRVFHKHDLEADVQINADVVWAMGYSGNGVSVAILDSGVESTHVELSDSVIITNNFTTGSDSDDDGHGTHVSGIVTANGVYAIEGNYATGVSPGAEIIVGKVCGDIFCFESDIMAGIEWAVAQGADVLNMSLGGGNFGGHCDDDPLAAKVNWAVSQGVVVAVSSGNDGSGVSSPACASGAIAVGAVDKLDNRPTWSNFGEALDLVAPGVGILSTYSCIAVGDCGYYWYSWMSGTSMSAPHVAGTAALIKQKNPGYTVTEIKDALYNSAQDLGTAGWDQYHGHGRIDAYGAINYMSTPSDNDGDGYSSDVDCNDNDFSVNPGANEVCNGIDDDCDELIDEGFDADGDGYTTCNGDCNDTDASINPEASETSCNGVDDNCDGTADEDYVSYSCDTGACEAASVCDGGAESCTPGMPTDEICGDGIDNDCDGTADEGCTPTAVCGDGVCAGQPYEDCSTCPSDCDGKTTGKPSNRWCCGDGVCGNDEADYCPVDCGNGGCETNAECDDGNACTNDECNVGECQNTWPACGLADGCCGPTCTPGEDSDCGCLAFKQGPCDTDSDCCTGLTCHPIKNYCR
jgi:hypothetical protein